MFFPLKGVSIPLALLLLRGSFYRIEMPRLLWEKIQYTYFSIAIRKGFN